jgi:hypothetical protein
LVSAAPATLIQSSVAGSSSSNVRQQKVSLNLIV